MYFLLDYRMNRPEVVFVSIYLDHVKQKRQQYLQDTDSEDQSLVLITKALDEQSIQGGSDHDDKTTL